MTVDRELLLRDNTMNTKTSSSFAHAFLVLPCDKGLSMTLCLLNAIKRQRYQHSNIQWHVFLTLPSLFSYTYRDAECYWTDWNVAMAAYDYIAREMELPTEQIHIIHDNPKKLIRRYTRNYPDWISPIHRTLSEKSWIIARWLWRKTKRNIRAYYSVLTKGFRVKETLEEELKLWFFFL